MCEQPDALVDKAAKLRLEQEAAWASCWAGDAAFLKKLHDPARRSVLAARERLRSLLSKVDFTVTFGQPTPGWLHMDIGDWHEDLEPWIT